MKVHLHQTQFDGWLHAACGRLDREPPSEFILDEDEFVKTPDKRMCAFCRKYWWPYGRWLDPEREMKG